MMKYEDFVEEIKNRMEVKLGKDYTVSVAEMLKNNSVVQRQLVIQKSDSSISPRIHLQGQYERYMEQPERARLDELTENIIQLYESQDSLCLANIWATFPAKDSIVAAPLCSSFKVRITADSSDGADNPYIKLYRVWCPMAAAAAQHLPKRLL